MFYYRNLKNSPEALAKTSITTIQTIFDEKQAKSVLSAAKRVTRKRSSGDAAVVSPAKRSKTGPQITSDPTPASIEASLALPTTSATEEDISLTILHTNRAPLVLAFAVMLLKYTMPSQPLSSRLSLAQAVVSANSRSKAVTIGLVEKGTGAEDQGWGTGQPGAKVMGREVKVMRRHGYNWREGTEKGGDEDKQETVQQENAGSQATLKQEDTSGDEEPALWGLDLEALRSANTPLVTGAQRADGACLPVHSAQNARAYLLKSFAPPVTDDPATPSQTKKSSAAIQRAEREENLACLLTALDLLYASWSHVLAKDELDRRAWSWYVTVRPEVKDGVAGWGGKGEVVLGRILELRRKG